MYHVIDGKQIKRLMRESKITIRDLSARMGITQKRIRQIRNGDREIITLASARDWIQGIIGFDPGLPFIKTKHGWYIGPLSVTLRCRSNERINHRTNPKAVEPLNYPEAPHSTC